MKPILELDHITKTFNDFHLEEISLNLESGYILGCIGPNGSGKTTIIRMIMNLMRPDSGTIRIFGNDITLDEYATKQVRDKIGFVFDESCLYEEILPLEMKDIIKRFYSHWDDREFRNYMDMFELPMKKALKHYSQGMKMKYVTAIALCHHARLIIMDEPTSGLDPVSRHEILEILQDYITREEASVFFSTHITSDLERIADYICLIDRGEHLFTLPKDELLERYRMVRGPLELLEDHNLPLLGLSKNSYGFEALTDQPQYFAERSDENTIVERCSLDDMMLYMTKRRFNS
jgi:ABC-2 type transport system ATP-binding protein